MLSNQVREFEAEVKRIGEEVTRIGEEVTSSVTSSLKRILPSSNNNNNDNGGDKTQQTTRMMAPRHSMPALRHSMVDLKRWSLDSSSLVEGVASVGLTPIDERFFTLPLQQLFEQDRVSF